MNFKKIITPLLLLIIAVLGIMYYQLFETNKALMESKNFNLEYNDNQEVLLSIWKKNNKLANQFIDRNFDNNFEEVYSYDAFGNLYQINSDTNENGVFEKCESFDVYGKNVGNAFDKDEDGAVEEFSIILDNKNEIRFLDIDNNGRFEKLILVNKINDSESEILTNELFK